MGLTSPLYAVEVQQDSTFTASELLILGIFYRRISSMLLHWIPSKQYWIDVGLVGNSFAPNGEFSL